MLCEKKNSVFEIGENQERKNGHALLHGHFVVMVKERLFLLLTQHLLICLRLHRFQKQ